MALHHHRELGEQGGDLVGVSHVDRDLDSETRRARRVLSWHRKVPPVSGGRGVVAPPAPPVGVDTRWSPGWSPSPGAERAGPLGPALTWDFMVGLTGLEPATP